LKIQFPSKILNLFNSKLKIRNPKYLILLLLFVFFADNLKAQNLQHTDTIQPHAEFENIYVRNLYSDSLVSSFVIFIKKEVKAHKHLEHSEHVYVLEGEGDLLLGDEQRKISKGDIIFIPKNTVHSLKVTSENPVKIISIQAPYFDGSDRILIE
jgi:mannose-6-phosphate isomerase-like protein (cupin superfamily)